MLLSIALALSTLTTSFDVGGVTVILRKSDANNVVYTGTHDNNTSQGWWLEASDAERQHVRDCLGLTPQDELEIHWQLITTACASVADTAIHPMQDVLGLDGSSRMNLPGVRQGCWEWRFNWDQVKAAQAQRLVRLGNRLGNLYRR